MHTPYKMVLNNRRSLPLYHAILLGRGFLSDDAIRTAQSLLKSQLYLWLWQGLVEHLTLDLCLKIENLIEETTVRIGMKVVTRSALSMNRVGFLRGYYTTHVSDLLLYEVEEGHPIPRLVLCSKIHTHIPSVGGQVRIGSGVFSGRRGILVNHNYDTVFVRLQDGLLFSGLVINLRSNRVCSI